MDNDPLATSTRKHFAEMTLKDQIEILKEAVEDIGGAGFVTPDWYDAEAHKAVIEYLKIMEANA